MFFGLAFLTPLVAQTLIALDWPNAGVDPLWVGLMVGGGLGLMAQLRGSWFWLR